MRWKAFLIALAPSFLIGAFVGSLPGYKAYEYVWKDADFCLSCHVHDYASASWERSNHGGKTTCHDCHHQPLRQYVHEAWVMLREQPKFPNDLKHTPYVPRDICEACHVSRPEQRGTITGPLAYEEIEKLPKVDQLWLHQKHLKAKVRIGLPQAKMLEHLDQLYDPGTEKNPERSITCIDCHGTPGNRAHHFTPVDTACLRCHQPQAQHAPFVKEVGCRNCHYQDFVKKISQF